MPELHQDSTPELSHSGVIFASKLLSPPAPAPVPIDNSAGEREFQNPAELRLNMLSPALRAAGFIPASLIGHPANHATSIQIRGSTRTQDQIRTSTFRWCASRTLRDVARTEPAGITTEATLRNR